MKYEEMNEHELNITLTALVNDCETYNVTDKDQSLLDCDFISHNEKHYEVADYCHDWNATMPLAVEHGLDIELADKNLGNCGQITKYIEGDTDIMIGFFAGENPLRAILICLIKTMENNQ